MIEAVRLACEQEGVLLDPVYSGKAMAALIDLIRRRYFRKGDKILFIYTGGAVALLSAFDTPQTEAAPQFAAAAG